ncbi:cadherin-related family member 5-like [Thrips palmi]|uniref:Cadherin-related family member 5-like n=1 Tax=Thrips palmi TaxID=161013 RepID=A0A6P8YG24_THRPL|nr:cadherin-related family member 5-like [Thrips palmi]
MDFESTFTPDFEVEETSFIVPDPEMSGASPNVEEEVLEVRVSDALYTELDVPLGVLRERNARRERHRPVTVWDRLGPARGAAVELSNEEEEEEETTARFNRFERERPEPEIYVIPEEEPEEGEVLDNGAGDPCVRKSQRGRVTSGTGRHVPANAGAPAVPEVPSGAGVATAPSARAIPGRVAHVPAPGRVAHVPGSSSRGHRTAHVPASSSRGHHTAPVPALSVSDEPAVASGFSSRGHRTAHVPGSSSRGHRTAHVPASSSRGHHTAPVPALSVSDEPAVASGSSSHVPASSSRGHHPAHATGRNRGGSGSRAGVLPRRPKPRTSDEKLKEYRRNLKEK